MLVILCAFLCFFFLFEKGKVLHDLNVNWNFGVCFCLVFVCLFFCLFFNIAFTRMPGDSYHGRLGSLLLCLCDVFRAQN